MNRLQLILVCAAIASCTCWVSHAQPVQDCGPVQLPRGPVSQQMGQCAIQHAQYLYSAECGASTVCNESRNVKAAYQLAIRIFDDSLYSLPEPANYAARQSQDIHHQFHRGFLAERAHEFRLASDNYKGCADMARETRDSTYLGFCLTGLNRLMCINNPGAPTCTAAQPTEEAVVYTTSESGGRAASVDIDGGDEPAPSTVSVTATINLPTAAEVATLRNSMTPEERQKLSQAPASHKSTTVKPR